MDVLDGRSVVSLSDDEILPAFDSVDAEINRLEEIRLQLIARVEDTGYAQELGARDAVELVSKRYRRDRAEVWRDVRLAKALPKYTAIGTALTNGIQLPTQPGTTQAANSATPQTGDTPDPDNANGVDGSDGVSGPDGGKDSDGVDGSDGVNGSDGGGGVDVRPMRTAQAAAIVSELERVRSRVPVEDLDIVEEQFVALAAHLSPAELRSAAREACDLLDSDGPEPEEAKAATRESLTLTSADRGVKFKGYLANENAELLRAVVHAGARPHKTIDGEPDPRSRDKRQADALSTALSIAATAWDTNTSSPPAPQPTTPTADTAGDIGTAGATNAARAASAPDAAGATDDAGASGAAGATDATDATGDSGAAGATDATGDSGAPVGADDARTAEGAATDGVVRCGAGGSAGGRGERVPGFGAKANITVTIDLDDLKAATADAIGQTVYSNGLSAAAIRRLACDANVIPVVLGANSEPLDVGRSERLVTKAIRRALNTRDRGCVVCGAPPVMCDAHHLTSWIDGGPTALWNLVLLCKRHHTDFHNGRWTITITNGQVHVARPTWADPPPLHRSTTTQGDSLRPRGTPQPPAAGPAGPETTTNVPARPRTPEPARPESPLLDLWGDGLTAYRSAPTAPSPAPPQNESARPNPTHDGTPDPAAPDPAAPDPSHPVSGELDSAHMASGELDSAHMASGESDSAHSASGQPEPAQATSPPEADQRALSGALAAGGRSSRWRGDAATYAEAARFAVWDGNPANEPGLGPPSFATA